MQGVQKESYINYTMSCVIYLSYPYIHTEEVKRENIDRLENLILRLSYWLRDELFH